jgi:hypothetical protein
METIDHKFYGYKITQNPSKPKLSLYMGGINAQVLRDIVSVDNAVGWDVSSNLWRNGGRNRVVIESHWQSIKDFLSSGNQERILPSAIVISVEDEAFKFEPFSQMQEIDYVTPGMITITGRYETNKDGGEPTPVDEKRRTAWVLDGQHRIKAFRSWSMPEPYPINVTIIQAWSGTDYEVGHKEYKRQIALSWIRKNLEDRGAVFSPNGIVGAPGLRTPHVITMSLLEKVIQTAFDHDSYLAQTYTLEKLDKNEVSEIGEYLFNFFEGVRLSIGLLNPNTKGTIGVEPEVNKAKDYWDIALKTSHKQRLLHNVGLKALVRGLLNPVMRSSNPPKNPQEVAAMLDHMRGIPWHDQDLQSKKDDWVVAFAGALYKMYESKGTSNKAKKYQMILEKTSPSGNVIDKHTIEAYGW